MTYPAPEYLKDDPWFGHGCFSLHQIDYKLAYEQAVIENLLLDDTNIEVKNIHELMYNIATGHGKTTLQLNSTSELGGGSENYHEGPGGCNSGKGTL
jgi:hypothetical protein